MARITFETKNRIASNSLDFPKFKLNKGERARIAVLENPEYGWVHDLRAPKITDGRPEYQIVQRKDGTSFEAPVKEWIGRHRCNGDDEMLEKDRGIDPKNCAICALAKEPGQMADAPKRRFAMHVVKYNTVPGTYDLTDAPFSVNVYVWQFTETMYDKLIGINSIVGSLQKNDLLLGPCTDAQFQKFDVNYALDAIWNSSPEYAEITKATLKSNRAPDLMAYVARASEDRWVQKDIETVREAYRILNGGGAEPKLAATQMPQLSQDMGNLIEDTKPAPAPAAAAPAASGNATQAATWDDLLG